MTSYHLNPVFVVCRITLDDSKRCIRVHGVGTPFYFFNQENMI